eukprot:scaffold1386_cov342-Pavlova_lutheri.AAC.10
MERLELVSRSMDRPWTVHGPFMDREGLGRRGSKGDGVRVRTRGGAPIDRRKRKGDRPPHPGGRGQAGPGEKKLPRRDGWMVPSSTACGRWDGTRRTSG